MVFLLRPQRPAIMSRLIIIVLIFSLLSEYGFAASDPLKQEQAKSYREQGLKLQEIGKQEEARMFFEKSLALDPNLIEVYNDLGIVYEKLGDMDAAEQMYRRSIELDPNYLPPYANLGFLYEKKGDFTKSAYYWNLRYKKGDKSDIWTEKAKTYFMRLSNYPGIGQEVKKMEAEVVSQELAQRKKREEEKINQKAKTRFDKGIKAYEKKLYKEAKDEFEAGYYMEPSDEKLKKDLLEYYRMTARIVSKEQAASHIENALNYLETEDYLALTQELKRAIAIVSEIPKN